MAEHEQLGPEGQGSEERSPAEVLQSDRNALAGELIDATGKVKFFSAYSEGASSEDGSRPDTSETFESQRKLAEDYLKATQTNLGAFDEANPGLRKLEEAPRREPGEDVIDFLDRSAES